MAIEGTDFDVGSVIDIECEPGYKLVGSSNIVCQDDGQFSMVEATCVKSK